MRKSLSKRNILRLAKSEHPVEQVAGEDDEQGDGAEEDADESPRHHLLEQRGTQLHQAFRSGLSHYFGPIRFNLCDPEYGTLLAEEELFHPRYNRHRCAECTMAFACAGCGNCGRCKDVELVDLNNIWVPE